MENIDKNVKNVTPRGTAYTLNMYEKLKGKVIKAWIRIKQSIREVVDKAFKTMAIAVKDLLDRNRKSKQLKLDRVKQIKIKKLPLLDLTKVSQVMDKRPMNRYERNNL